MSKIGTLRAVLVALLQEHDGGADSRPDHHRRRLLAGIAARSPGGNHPPSIAA
jgi:hypothetical protein